VSTLLLLVAFLLVLRSLGAPASVRRSRPPADFWGDRVRRLGEDVRRGMATLDRLAAARRDRLGRPWC
jgi:hypothetical protein